MDTFRPAGAAAGPYDVVRSEHVELVRLGRWKEAEECLLAGVDRAFAAPCGVVGPAIGALVYMAGAPQGDSERYPGARDHIPVEFAGVVRAAVLVNHGTGRDEAVAIAARTLDTEGARQGAAFWLSLMTLIYADELDTAADHVDRTLAWPDWAANPRRRDMHAMLAARVDWARGASVAAHDQWMAMLERDHFPMFTGLAVAWAATAKVELGDVAGAEELLRRHGFDGPLAGVQDSPELLAARGTVRYAAGRPATAYQDQLQCGRRLRGQGVDNPAVIGWRTRAARCAAETQRRVLSAALANEEVVAAGRWGTPRALGVAEAEVGLAAERGPDVQHLQRAVELLAGPHTRRELMHVRYHLGMRLSQVKQYVAGDVQLAAAAATARATGHSAFARRAEHARRLWAPGGGFRELTPQARAVAGLARVGYGNKEIARMLYMTIRTVEFHLSNIYRRLDVGGRAGLASLPLPLP
jgi:DNA-binding CsgD family transcriptional regulator